MFTELKSALTQLGHEMSEGGTLNGSDQQKLRDFHFFSGKNPIEAAYEYAFNLEQAIASDLKIALVKLGIESADELPSTPVVDASTDPVVDASTDPVVDAPTDLVVDTTSTDEPESTDTPADPVVDTVETDASVSDETTNDKTPVTEETTVTTEDTDTEVQ